MSIRLFPNTCYIYKINTVHSIIITLIWVLCNKAFVFTFYLFGSCLRISETSLNYLIWFFILSFCAFVFTILIILHTISGVVLHDNLALLWWGTSSINHADPLILWFLHTVSIFSCDCQNDSSQRYFPGQFYSYSLNHYEWFGYYLPLSLKFGGLIWNLHRKILHFSSFRKALWILYNIFELKNKSIQRALFWPPIGNRVGNISFQLFFFRIFIIHPYCNKVWCNN